MGRAFGWIAAFVVGVGLVYLLTAASDDGQGNYNQPQVSGVVVEGVVIAPYVNERTDYVVGYNTRLPVVRTDYFLLLDTDGDGVGDTNVEVPEDVWQQTSAGDRFERR